MLARCMIIAPNRHPIKIKEKDYEEFLKLDYEEFKKTTNIWGCAGIEPYNYRYCISKECDSKKARLNYIDYLVNQKGFNI